jgi:carbamoyltransferase
MLVLGIHKDPWHNTGAAAIYRGEEGIPKFVFISEERLDREKDSRAFPLLAINKILNILNLCKDDIDLIIMDYIIDRDWQKDNKINEEDVHEFFNGIDKSKIRVMDHHLAHAYATFYSSNFDNSAVLVVDGRGSQKETQSLFKASIKDGIEKVNSTDKASIGLLYASITQLIGFKLLQEGKTMGLAPYGKNERILDLNIEFNGIETDYSHLMYDGTYQLKKEYMFDRKSFQDKANIAFEIQEECEKVMLHLAQYAKTVTEESNLCLSGGVALNSVANYKVLQKNIFNDIFINPACSDTGIPLGCALYGYHTILKQPKNYNEISPYLGVEYSENEIMNAIDKFEGFQVIKDSDFQECVELLSTNKIVACHQGRSEMGPRALGNRSILMSPLEAKNKDTLNSRVKHRESFRPFAPACLEEYVHEYYDIDRPSPYMLFVPSVKEDKKDILKAVTHVDGTGRLQTLTRERNQHFYEIVNMFYKKTGVPILLNTSFNIAGEPIVETPENAIVCFLNNDIDALLIGNYLLVKDTNENQN